MNKKLSYVILALVVVLAFAFAAPSSADAEWVIKNNTSQTIYVAIAYWDGDTWVSEGWWSIGGMTLNSPGGSVTVISGDLEYREYYCYAISYDGDDIWEGDYWFLTSDDSFRYTNADRGTDRYQSKGFFECNAGDDSDMTTTLSY